MTDTYELVIIGGGVMGLSTAYYASKQGKKVVVLEQFEIGNPKGSSPGTSRQYRLMHSEISQGKLAKRTPNMWQALEDDSKTLNPAISVPGPLLQHIDELWFGENDKDVIAPEGNFLETRTTCDLIGIDIEEILNPKVLETRYNFKNIPSNFIAFNGRTMANDPSKAAAAGNINVPYLIQALKQLSERTGLVTFVEKEAVTAIQTGNIITVTGQSGTKYVGKKLVVTAGAWTNNVTSLFGITFDYQIWEMLSCYFKIDDLANKHKYPMWISFSFREKENEDIWGPDPSGKNGIGYYYGFAESDWERPGYIRVCPTEAEITKGQFTDPADAQYVHNPDEVTATQNWVAKHISGVSHVAEHISTCLTTITSDGHFICGLAPGHKNIAIFNAGWGMKFVPIFGKLLNELVDGIPFDDELKEIFHDFRLDREAVQPKPQEQQAAVAQQNRRNVRRIISRF